MPARWGRVLAGRWAAVVLLLAAGGVAAAPTVIPGSRVSLEVPPGFAVATGFAGIAQADSGVSVQIAELPTPSGEMRAAMDAAQLATRGMRLVERSEVASAIGDATLLTVTRETEGGAVHSLILVAGDSTDTVLLTASAPERVWGGFADTLRATLMTATWNPQASVDPAAALGFRVTPTADLEPAHALTGAVLLVASRDPADAPEKGGPFALVRRSDRIGDGNDLARLARRAIAGMNRMSEVEIGQENDFEMGGMPAHEVIATARLDGREVTFYQALGHDGRSYYLVQGFVEVARDARFVPQFRTLAATLEVLK